MLTYKRFIEELREFLKQAEDVMGPIGPQSPEVLPTWQRGLVALVERIEAEGYRINCTAASRPFHVKGLPFHAVTAGKHRQQMMDDLGAVILELRVLITTYDKLGEPRKQAEVNATRTPLVLPEEVTIRWVINHVPVRGWFAAGAVLVAAFGGGIGFGRSKLYEVLMHLAGLQP
ncbi:MAG: hypothetical protein IPG63_14195 [Xanthomonadales bacterium]|nr:hypothetical protein [Xanthomonadales bacterium]